eukprot:gene12033-biopygen4903
MADWHSQSFYILFAFLFKATGFVPVVPDYSHHWGRVRPASVVGVLKKSSDRCPGCHKINLSVHQYAIVIILIIQRGSAGVSRRYRVGLASDSRRSRVGLASRSIKIKGILQRARVGLTSVSRRSRVGLASVSRPRRSPKVSGSSNHMVHSTRTTLVPIGHSKPLPRSQRQREKRRPNT